jgi:hypothetical protein
MQECKGTPVYMLHGERRTFNQRSEVMMNYMDESRDKSDPAVNGEHGFSKISFVSYSSMYLDVLVLSCCVNGQI